MQLKWFLRATILGFLILLPPAAGQDSDLQSAREWIVNQPHDFSNEVLFETRGRMIVRSSRFSQGSQIFGDFDADGDVDQHDYYAMQICLSFSGPGFTTPPACSVFDIDFDEDIDLFDAAAFQNAFVGTLSGVLVEAGELVPVLSSYGNGYYSGAPGTWDNNALNGIARQAGYSQDDLWYHWTLIAKPDGSGDVIIANNALPSTAYTITPPPLIEGRYDFQLKVTNLLTGEFGLDSTVLKVSCHPYQGGCNDDVNCTDDFCDGQFGCVWISNCSFGSCNINTGNCEVVFGCTGNAACNDEVSCTTDTCNLGTGQCEFTPIDTACDDNLFCNGTEGAGSCDPDDPDAEAGTGCLRLGNPCANPTPMCNEAANSCQPCVTNAQCNDGFSCTSDTCSVATGVCNNTALNTSCPDPLKCDGDDICDPTNADADATTGCYPPGNPCAPKVCNEATYVVGDPATCANCTSNADCSDGIVCTNDVCDGGTGNCTLTPTNSLCPDSLFCNGDDICDPADVDAGADGCVNGLPGYPCANACNETTNACFACTSNLECSDGLACTDDLCNGVTGACTHTDNCAGAPVCNFQNGQCGQANGGSADVDGDGVPDDTDNCPTDANPDQANSDGDACGNVCDADCDGGGTPSVQVNAGADRTVCPGQT